MRKIYLILSIILISNTIKAQQLSYGVIIGGIFYETANNNNSDLFSTAENFSANLGGYLEYNFNEKMGVKTEITFNKRQINYFQQDQEFKLNIIEISPDFKYDFGSKYREGFYMLAGPKISIISKAESQGTDVKKVFDTTYFGAQLGFGWRIFSVVDIQTKLGYELTPFYKSGDRKSKFFDAGLSLNIDLQKIIDSK